MPWYRFKNIYWYRFKNIYWYRFKNMHWYGCTGLKNINWYVQKYELAKICTRTGTGSSTRFRNMHWYWYEYPIQKYALVRVAFFRKNANNRTTTDPIQVRAPLPTPPPPPVYAGDTDRAWPGRRSQRAPGSQRPRYLSCRLLCGLDRGPCSDEPSKYR